jgi:hypothetical protein
MDPKEVESPEGRLRFNILRAMFRAVAAESGWIEPISNWTLGAAGGYVALLIANLDKIQSHLSAGWPWPVFWCLLISVLCGIGIKILSGFIQFSLNVERQLLEFILPALTNPQQFGISADPNDAAFIKRIVDPVQKEFIESRPWIFRKLAEYGQRRGKQDLVYIPKTAASFAQWMLLCWLLQFGFLGAAIFSPIGFIH